MMLRQNVSAPGLWNTVREYFKTKVSDPRKKGSEKMRDFSIVDCLMSASALFSLKSPSLLQFDKDSRTNETIKHNLKALFGVPSAPSDTQMRALLDLIDPQEIRGVYKKIFSTLQRGKVLEQFIYLDDAYLLALDGTGYFSSKKIFCKNCCKKEHKDGSITYYHQMLSGVLIHPEKKAVIPIAPEPIVQQDGSKKNDCERNAAIRFLKDFRREHPHLKVIVTEDGLSSNAPHIQLLQDLDLGFILGCKSGDHTFLFDFVNASEALKAVSHLKITDAKVQHKFRWMNQIALNEANPDCLVNFLEYWETIGDKTTHWSWVTHLTLTKKNAIKVMRAGRARWGIENETFNTLKNSNYKFEHNFGHGNKNLSVVLALLMVLAFFIDQVQQITCRLFQKARERCHFVQREHWFKMRSYFDLIKFKNWDEFLGALAGTITLAIQLIPP